MLVDAVIFDWSGTISDDLDVVIDATNRLLDRLGSKFNVTKDYLRKNYKPDYMDFYKKLGINASRPEINKLYKEEFLRSKIKPRMLENVAEILNWIKSDGKKIFVVSSHPLELLKKESEDYGLSHLIEKFYADSIKKEDAINEIIKIYNYHKSKVVFVGDTFVDIDAGKAAGVITVAVLTGYQDLETIKIHKPEFVMDGVSGLREIFN